ncbi:MAG: Putative stomatin/prohibitin-family membrane protease subunit aq_911, partial [uncultured Thermomicrobiales bacterium]
GTIPHRRDRRGRLHPVRAVGDRQDRAGVRAGRRLPARPAARPARPRHHLPDPVHRADAQDRPAHGHDGHPGPGGHHPRQRHRPGQRRRLLPRRRPQRGGRQRRRLHPGHVADLADDAPECPRAGGTRRPALGAGQDQPGPPADHRRADRAVGRQGQRRRGQGRGVAAEHAAGDGPAGRGRAGEAGQDHPRRGRVPGQPATRQGGRHHQPEPGHDPVALPADADRDRRRAEHDGDRGAAGRRERHPGRRRPLPQPCRDVDRVGRGRGIGGQPAAAGGGRRPPERRPGRLERRL